MDKIDLLLDALEHPEHHSSQDIEALLADPDVREAYDLIRKTKSSLAPIQSPDVDAEWEDFSRSHKKHRGRILNFFSRNVAASVAIGIASLAAVAAVVSINMSHTFAREEKVMVKETAKAEQKYTTPADTSITTAAENISLATPEIIVFDNETLETMLPQIAQFYGYNVEFFSNTQKSLRLYFRWNQAQSVEEVVEGLNNFEQIHINIEDTTLRVSVKY